MIQMIQKVQDLLPAVSTLSPVTVTGAAIVAGATLLYLICRAPELLMVAFTAMIYAAVPLFPHS